MEPAADTVPLVVDMDGTLLRTDSLLESLFFLARTRPLSLLRIPLWWIRGRAHLKKQIALRAVPDADTLPLDQPLLDFLVAQKQSGRTLVLASGADERVAQAVAQRCGVFDRVLASDGVTNLTGFRKRNRLVAEFGLRGFDYIGNSAQDLPVWHVARRALLVAPSARLRSACQAGCEIERVFARSRPGVGTTLAAMRPQHWLKNLLLLVPIVFQHSLYDAPLLAHALLGALCFSLAASGVYLLNDLLDLDADRKHPQKMHRALASGALPIGHALLLIPALWLASAVLAWWLPLAFTLALGVYLVLMLAYSLRLKDIAMVDALLLAMGYSLRILAGALAVGVDVSAWLLVCSSAMFFGLALLKRYAELVVMRPSLGEMARLRAYRISDAAIVATLGGAAGCVAVALLALYPTVEPSDHAAWPLWLVCTFLLLWVGHMWLMAQRGNIRDDPVAFALRDPVSRLFGLMTVAVLVLAL